jgi:hypothetical protein
VDVHGADQTGAKAVFTRARFVSHDGGDDQPRTLTVRRTEFKRADFRKTSAASRSVFLLIMRLAQCFVFSRSASSAPVSRLCGFPVVHLARDSGAAVQLDVMFPNWVVNFKLNAEG